MLNPKKKLAKREMEKDPLLTSYEGATDFYYTYKKQIGQGLIALVVVAAALFFYLDNRRQNNERASEELAKVFSIYDAGATDPSQYTIAMNGQTERGIVGLKTIVDKYGSSASGNIARYYLANCYLNLGQYDEAIKQFKAFSGSSKLLTSSAYAGLGACYEAKKMYKDGASSYEDAASAAPAPAMIPDDLVAAARCYGMAGEKEKAVSLLKKVKREYPNSTAARDVDRFIEQFSV